MANAPKGWGLDMTRWTKKVNGASAAMNRIIIPRCVEKGMDMINEQVSANLNGIRHDVGTPAPTPGQLPVTRITSNLAGAVVSIRIQADRGIVFIDKGKAPYAINVHKGVKKDGGGWAMRPRRFFAEAIRIVRPKLIAYWEAQIRLVGKL